MNTTKGLTMSNSQTYNIADLLKSQKVSPSINNDFEVAEVFLIRGFRLEQTLKGTDIEIKRVLLAVAQSRNLHV